MGMRRGVMDGVDGLLSGVIVGAVDYQKETQSVVHYQSLHATVSWVSRFWGESVAIIVAYQCASMQVQVQPMKHKGEH